MNFTAASILEYLDNSDYALINSKYDIAAVRVVGFCNQEKWAIIFELLMDYPSSDGIGLMILAYGSGIKVEKGHGTPLLHTTFEVDIEYDDDRDYVKSEKPKSVEVYIRGEWVTIDPESVFPSNTTLRFEYNLLVELIETYGTELFSTNDELYLYISRDLKKIVQFDGWYYEDEEEGGEDYIREYTSVLKYIAGLEVMAEILATGNLELYKSVNHLGLDWWVFS
jgi:hypothetical protein